MEQIFGQKYGWETDTDIQNIQWVVQCEVLDGQLNITTCNLSVGSVTDCLDCLLIQTLFAN